MSKEYRPEKTAKRVDELKKLLQPDSRPMKAFGMAGDYMILGLLWTIVCFPVITAGAATCALYRVSRHLLNHEESGGLLRDCWEGFRENFKQGTLAWLLVLAVGAFLFLDLWFYWLWAGGSAFGVVLFGIFTAIAILWLFVSTWLFGYISRFVCTIKEALRNSFLLSIRHAGWTVLMLAAEIGLLVLCLNFPILIIVWPGMIAYINGLVFERIYKKIRVQVIGSDDTPETPEEEDNGE